MEQNIIEFVSEINEWRVSLQACLRVKEKFLSKSCNNFNNWLNQQRIYMCKTLIC